MATTGVGSWRAAHGTGIAGLVLRRAPDVEIDIEGALDRNGRTMSWNVANSIASFALSGIDILNLSFSCYPDDGLPPLALATAIDRLDPWIVVVVAAGNYPTSPCSAAALNSRICPPGRPRWTTSSRSGP